MERINRQIIISDIFRAPFTDARVIKIQFGAHYMNNVKASFIQPSVLKYSPYYSLIAFTYNRINRQINITIIFDFQYKDVCIITIRYYINGLNCKSSISSAFYGLNHVVTALYSWQAS